MSEKLTRDAVLRIRTMIQRELSTDYNNLKCLVNDWANHDAALRASRDAERERAEQSDAIMAQHERNQEGSNGRIIALEQQLAAMTTERNDLNDTRQGLEAELAELRERYTNLKEAGYVAELEQQVANLTTKLAGVGEEHALTVLALRKAHQETLTSLQQQLTDAKTKLSILADQANENGAYMQTLLQECHDSKIQHMSDQTKIARLEQTNSYNAQFSQVLAEKDLTIDAQLREAATLNQCITDLEATVARIQAQPPDEM